MLKRYFVTCCVIHFFCTLENSSRNHNKKIVSCINDCTRSNRPRLKFGTVNYFVFWLYRILTL